MVGASCVQGTISVRWYTDYLPWQLRHRYPVNLQTIFHLFLSTMYLYSQWAYHEKFTCIVSHQTIPGRPLRDIWTTIKCIVFGVFIICMTLLHNISISGHILAFRFSPSVLFLTLKVNCKKKRICILRHLVSDKALFLLQIMDCTGISDCQEFH